RTGNVPGRDGSRDSQTESALVVADRFYIMKLNTDVLARWNIGNPIAKQVGTLLGQQARLLAGGSCRLIDLPGTFSLADLTHNTALANGHGHIVHSALTGKREDVLGF